MNIFQICQDGWGCDRDVRADAEGNFAFQMLELMFQIKIALALVAIDLTLT